MTKQTNSQPVCAASHHDATREAANLFQTVWRDLQSERGVASLRFPTVIYWLNGAPGAGKGTQTQFIMQLCRLGVPPIVMSDLLQSPEAKKIKDRGQMVGDREVLGLILRKLCEPAFAPGALVDGFPRTLAQVECLKLLHQEMQRLHDQNKNSPQRTAFPTPDFHFIVLNVSEAVSIQRQLSRGMKVKAGQEAGELRATDLDENAARTRYRVFKEVTFDPLDALKNIYPCHFIDASGSVADVQKSLVSELGR